MFMVVITIANRIEAVIVTKVETVTEIHYICHALAGDTIHCRAGEAERDMLNDLFRNDCF